MARKNRKKNGAGPGFFPVSLAIGLTVISILCLAYLCLGLRCEALGRDLKAMEAECRALNKQLTNEEAKWHELVAPGNLARALAEHRLDMRWPRRDQVVTLTDTALRRGQRPLTQGDALTYVRVKRTVRHE